ncbi:hypothetical protein GW17_00028708 [Ensete ventricosum]|uniref:Uncharacterized protein n=1 Tax=Ensete ventricosum TaxID=4639 RepID=A0A426XSC3_ENSVE|nr:hypothetical protein B296_00057157 [Ensete ventricosum]RWW07893.1 hypothetical protein GW17_00028708 [Ensete ventricosum]
MGKKTFCNMAMVGESSMGISFCNMDLVSESPMGTSDSKTPRMLRDSVELFKHWAVGLTGSSPASLLLSIATSQAKADPEESYELLGFSVARHGSFHATNSVRTIAYRECK